MKNFLFILCVFVISNCFSQQYTLPTELVQTFLQDKNPSTGLDIIIETKFGTDKFYETIVKYSGNTESFKLKPLTYPNFEVKLKQAIKNVIKATKIDDVPLITTIPDNGVIKRNIPSVFTQIVTFHNTAEEQPMVATIYLKSSSIPIFYEKNSPLINLINPTVEISFYGGFIEKIQLQGKINGIPLTFNNKYSMGISSTKNIGQLDTYTLFSDDKFSKTEINNMFTNGVADLVESQQSESDNKSLKVNVSDIIRYVKKVDVNANDVSPVPQLLILDENQTETKLYREETSKLFEAVVYSDLLGLFEENNPNGIIQTEINKRFNLNTKRTDTKWYHKIFILPLFSEGIGTFQSFDASFQYTKIESENKFVSPTSFKVLDLNNQVLETIDYYTPIGLYRLRNFAVGGILNFVTMENQNSKLNMYLNGGFLFGRTGLKNDVDDENGFYTNNLEIPIEFQFHILPEKRVSFLLSDRLSWFDTFDSNVNVQSLENNELVSKNKWLNSFNIDLNVDISETGRLFLRYKFTHEVDKINNNYSRLQFGYSFFLLKNNGTKRAVNR